MEFSVIVPVYKVEAYIPTCVESILAQTFRDFELILVDDGSPDASGAICDEYAAKDHRVIVIHQENGGVVSARAAGLARAQGEYICFVDGDDYVEPTCLETAAYYAGEGTRPEVLMYGCVQEYGDRSEPFSLKPEPGFYDKAALREKIYPYMLYDCRKPFFQRLLPSCFWFSVWKRELVKAHYMEEEWWPRIKEYEDVCVTYECIWNARSVYICPETPYHYNCTNPSSATTAYFPGHVRNLSACIRYMDSHLGAQAPEMRTQINAHMALRTIASIAQEFRHGHSYREALRNVRREMNATKLPSQLSCRGLPFFIGSFILCLKLRLYFLAVLATKMRMNSDGIHDFA